MTQDPLKRYSQLKKMIEKYNYKYRLGSPLIEDDYYDNLFSEFKKIENELGISAINTIEDPINGLKVKHTSPLLSLDHGFEDEAIENFIKKMDLYAFPMIVEHKIDGVSLSIKYINGKIKQILTRGNGLEGLDVTHKLKDLDLIKEILYTDDLEIRGELYTTFTEFEKIKDQFTSPRNYCASFLHQKKPQAKVKLFFAIHDCITFKGSDYIDVLSRLKELDLPVTWNRIVYKTEEVIKLFWDIMKNRNKIDYPIDGVVLKINDSKRRQELGYHLTAPRYAIAIKMHSETKSSQIKKIDFSVGKFGNITPIAIIEEVKIGNHLINRVSMHNINEVNKNRYGIGDIVEIEHAGEAVPQIVKKIFDSNNPIQINHCPSCGSLLHSTQNTLRCNNSWKCIDQKIARITHFCSRNAMNIEGLNEKRVRQLVEMDFINFPQDLFKLQTKELVSLDGWSYKVVENLFQNLKKVKHRNLENIIFALCIPNIGYGKAKIITKYCDSLDSFFEKFNDISITDWPNIGKVAGKSIFTSLNSDDSAWFYDLRQYLKV